MHDARSNNSADSGADNRYAVSPAVAHTAERINSGDIPYAGFWRRAGAYLIDYSLVGFVLKLLAAAILTGPAGGGKAALYVLILAIGGCLYYALLESSDSQATLGKRTLGIKVTDLRGEQISFGRALGRVFAHALSSLIVGFGFVMASFTERRQTLHDKIAGTLVVKREESPAEIAAAGPAAPVSGWLIAAGVVLCLLFGVGLISAISIPAYQQFTLRAQIAEGLVVAEPFKAAVESAVAAGKPLSSISSATLDVSLPATAKYVESVRVVRGAIDIEYGRSVNQKLTGGHVVLVPGLSDRMQLRWICGHARPLPDVPPAIDDYQKYTNIPDALLPSACRLAYGKSVSIKYEIP
jgi:uncharacterized RDD family membrane protein YckC/Tfp pilus assembly major pilin PilA